MLRLFLVTNIRVYAFCKTKPLNLHIRSLLTVVRHEKNVVETRFFVLNPLEGTTKTARLCVIGGVVLLV